MAASRKGELTNPKATLLNRYMTMFSFSGLVEKGSFSQKNLVTSHSESCNPTWRKAFAMSAMNTILFSLKWNITETVFGRRTSPQYMQTFSDSPFLEVFAEASKTTRTFVVLSGEMMHWWGK